LLVDLIIENFIISCYRTFYSDLELYKKCNVNGLIKMEEMVKSREYFDSKIFNKITNSNADSSYLDKFFQKRSHINVHEKSKRSPFQIFKFFPNSFKQYILKIYKNKDLFDLYSQLSYQEPQ